MGLALGFLVYRILAFQMFDDPIDKLVYESKSPSGFYTAAVIHRLTGATDPNYTMVTLRESSKRGKGDKIIFYEENFERPVLKWSNENTLAIQFDPSISRFGINVTNWLSVQILYSNKSSILKP